MAQDHSDEQNLRDYLLGSFGDERAAGRIESKILLESDFYERLLILEDELIDEYLDETLSREEAERFEKYFLAALERREKLAFARALRQELAQIGKTDETRIVRPKPWAQARGGSRAFRALKIAAAILIVLAAGLAIWRILVFQSDADKGLAELRGLYRHERPFESRLSNFPYAPFSQIRGDERQTDFQTTAARDRAARRLLDAARDEPGARTFAALGSFYLTEKRFEPALAQFEAALKLEPANARLHNDYGAALLEAAQNVAPDDESGARMENLARALTHFDRAAELQPFLLEAMFNKALALEKLNLLEQSKQAWREYLAQDAASPWSVEARKHLQNLESKVAETLSPDSLEAAFLAAYREADEDKAFRLISQNRELINQKYLPQRLAMSFLNAEAGAKAEKLELLRFLGDLEKKRINDFFAADLAEFYGNVSEDKIGLLQAAQAAVKNGYKLCLKTGDFTGAASEFERARKLFLQAGNVLEADTVCRHFIAYCFYFSKRRGAALDLLQAVNEFCLKQKYQWFALMNNYWLIGAEESLGLKTLTEASQFCESSLETARALEDFYLTQQFLKSLVGRSHFFRQQKKTLGFLQSLLEFNRYPNVSARQKFRNLNQTVEALSPLELESFSKAAVLESVSLGEALTDPTFAVGAEINAGAVHTQTGDYDEAEKWLSKARQNAANLIEAAARNEQSAIVYLKFGDLERKRDNLPEAADFYRQSATAAENANKPVLFYEAKKNELLTDQAAGDNDAVEKNIEPALRLAERFRREISDEQARNSFFDDEQSIYDVAVEHEIRRSRTERAYDYAEASNARSLLDWTLRGEAVSIDKQNAVVVFRQSAEPLKINEIRNRLPAQTQILQYTILENKVLLWLISKNDFRLVTAAIDSKTLKEKVDEYLRLLQTKDRAALPEADAAARELHRILIEPMLPWLDQNKEICIIPNKVLFRLPFAALVAGDNEYFLEKFAFFYAPSANVYVSSSEAARSKTNLTDEKVLSVGNPLFDRRQYPNLPDLPDAADEAGKIAENYQASKVLIGRQATKNAFRENLKNFEIVHFAGHYLPDGNHPLRSKLIMAKPAGGETESFLTNAELLGDKLTRTKLVVLSACQTGVENYYNGEGAVGLSRTFLTMNVPLVVASQWQADSAASAELMEKFHRYRARQKLSTVKALRQAQLDLLRAPDPTFRSARFWAAFAVYGGHAEF